MVTSGLCQTFSSLNEEKVICYQLELENNLLTFQLNAPVIIRAEVMTTEAFSQNIGKLISKLKLTTDNLLFIYAEAN